MKILAKFWFLFCIFLWVPTTGCTPLDENVITKPKARLYTGQNLTGTFVDFNLRLKSNPKCLTLSNKMRGQIKSINTFGTCVRLYDDGHCWQNSMAFYPQPPTFPEDGHQIFLTEVKSIGPCFENELDDAQIDLDTMSGGSKFYTKLLSKKGPRFVPDVVTFGSVANYNETGSTPIDYYRRGGGPHNGRLEYVRATLRKRNVRKVEVIPVTEEDQKFYDQEKEEGDQLGHFVNAALGPQKGLLPFRNIFAQNLKNKKMMDEMDQTIVDKLCQTNGLIYFYMNVHYLTDTGVRPSGMTYVIEFNGRIMRMKYLSNLN